MQQCFYKRGSEMNEKKKSSRIQKGKFSLHCLIHGHDQDLSTYNGARFKCFTCGATRDRYIN